MASISSDRQGNRTIQFVAGDRKRRSIRLGKLTMKRTEKVCVKVEELNAAAITGDAITKETAGWVRELPDKLHAKLAKVGLVTPREHLKGATLAKFTDAFIVRRNELKPGTITNWRIAQARLVEFFGEDRELASIHEGDVEHFLAHLHAKYARATIGKTIKMARQLFRSAIRHRHIDRNPFTEFKAPSMTNAARQFFVTRDVAQRVIAACPDAEWRLIFALSRYGGLRCPSEHLGLTWQDIDWERGRFLVRSPKQEGNDDGGERWVPIFPELRVHLDAAFDDPAAEGTTYVIRRYRERNCNLRTQLVRIIRRAGVTPWPRLFQNLRSSRETELTNEHPLHVVCAWIGNSPRVAADHYLQVTDDHFKKAAAESGAATGGFSRIWSQQAASRK